MIALFMTAHACGTRIQSLSGQTNTQSPAPLFITYDLHKVHNQVCVCDACIHALIGKLSINYDLIRAHNICALQEGRGL